MSELKRDILISWYHTLVHSLSEKGYHFDIFSNQDLTDMEYHEVVFILDSLQAYDSFQSLKEK